MRTQAVLLFDGEGWLLFMLMTLTSSPQSVTPLYAECGCVVPVFAGFVKHRSVGSPLQLPWRHVPFHAITLIGRLPSEVAQCAAVRISFGPIRLPEHSPHWFRPGPLQMPMNTVGA